jgi:hypothetical protein
MSDLARDLWPDDIGVSDLISPIAILKDQASVLAQKTKGLVEGNVTSQAQDTTFYLYFDIVAPAMGNYRYRLITVIHPVEFYPLRIQAEFRPEARANSQEEFVEKLREIFSSDKVKSVVRALVAQSQK